MRAMVLEQPGNAARLRLVEMPVPALGPDDVLVRVKACGVCHHDVAVMRGLLRRGVKARVVLGHEIAGEVAAVGPAVQAVRASDRVASILTNACGHCAQCAAGNEHRCLNGQGIGHGADGGYAEYVRLTAFSVRPIPANVTYEQAALCACPIGVALRGVLGVAGLRAGENLLVTGASGGLGSHSLQIGKLVGARVLAVTTSKAKVDRLQALGADEVILSPTLDFQWEALALTQDAGVDVVVDTVGSGGFQGCFQSLAQYGRLLLLGEIQGGEASLSPAALLFKEARVLGSTGAGRADLDQALTLVSRGQLSPIATPFPLHEAEKVHDLMMARSLFGRAVLIP